MNRLLPILLIACFVYCSSTANKQHPKPSPYAIYTVQDSVVFATTYKRCSNSASTNGGIMIRVAKEFIGKPYIAHTLEQDSVNEKLILNCREFDCVTFVENVVALTMSITYNDSSFAGFASNIEKIRYRNGKRSGYGSRLHYFTEWLYDNKNKGLIEIISNDSLYVTKQRTTDFMSSHAQSYPHLHDSSVMAQIIATEQNISHLPYTYLPKANVQKSESLIQQGDIIVITSNIKGLDALHTGLAIFVNKRLHLLHASSKGEVMISKVPLHDYLQKHKSQSGIMVGRMTITNGKK